VSQFYYRQGDLFICFTTPVPWFKP